MPGSISNYAENIFLEHLVGRTSWSVPTVYLALSTAPITDATTGSSITEPSGNNYSRILTTGGWGAASDGSITNSAAFSFPTASGDWGTITYFALVDNSSGGNILAWAELVASKTITTGDVLQFSIGSLTITAD